MQGRVRAVFIRSMFTIGIFANTASADDTAVLDVLEARLAAQQQQIDELQRQIDLASGQAADESAATMKRLIREVLDDPQFRASLSPSVAVAGYDNGFYVRASDNTFSMRLNGMIQTRWTSYGTQQQNRYLLPRLRRDDRTGFDLSRLRLTLRGHVFDENLTYVVEARADSSISYDVEPFYTYVNYRVADEFQITAGLFKIASTRAEMTSVAELQFPDRPIPNSVFTLERGVGVRFWGDLFKKQLTWYVDVVNGFNSTREQTITVDPAEHDNSPAIASKLIWHVLSEDYKKDFRAQSDFERRTTPALDLGLGYAFTDDEFGSEMRLPFPRTRPLRGGGFGLTTGDALQFHQIGVDAAFKYAGLSVTSEYWARFIDPRHANGPPFTPWSVLTGDEDSSTQQGAYVQVGYFLPIPGLENKLEALARVGGVSVSANEQEGSWDYGGGLNYYIQGNRVKLQTAVTRVYEAPARNPSYSLANLNDEALIWTVQLQVGF